MKKFLQCIFSIKNDKEYKILTFFGIKIKFFNYKKHTEQITNVLLMNLHTKVNSLTADEKFNIDELLNSSLKPYNRVYLDSNNTYIDYLFPNCKGTFDNTKPEEENPDFFYIHGSNCTNSHINILVKAAVHGKKVYVIEDGFFRSLFSHTYKDQQEPKYHKGIGFSIDDISHYIDASIPSRLEMLLNDKKLVINDEQKARARKCIEKILETHLSKYNNQPIYTPKIGRNGVKKILVVDQSYGDRSITQGWASDKTFEDMLETAVKENPDSDIIIKTHPDTMSGKRGGYYTTIKPHDNIYTMTDPINPISLIKYCDKVYVCTTQLGFEALMCGREVHTFGMPFYAGWGLTVDAQKCSRRTNTRTLEEAFYIAYIMYSLYVNPDKKCRCEVEDAMEYLLNLREEYFKSN